MTCTLLAYLGLPAPGRPPARRRPLVTVALEEPPASPKFHHWPRGTQERWRSATLPAGQRRGAPAVGHLSGPRQPWPVLQGAESANFGRRARSSQANGTPAALEAMCLRGTAASEEQRRGPNSPRRRRCSARRRALLLFNDGETLGPRPTADGQSASGGGGGETLDRPYPSRRSSANCSDNVPPRLSRMIHHANDHRRWPRQSARTSVPRIYPAGRARSRRRRRRGGHEAHTIFGIAVTDEDTRTPTHGARRKDRLAVAEKLAASPVSHRPHNPKGYAARQHLLPDEHRSSPTAHFAPGFDDEGRPSRGQVRCPAQTQRLPRLRRHPDRSALPMPETLCSLRHG